ncbi:MAG: hypothetical protein A2X56_01230 [Nitrospirae bacterium GWC2_57_13]|jgi:uncharacterized protein|nr:MAG: hypothetical protein A2X56_01230 [Nitrospirae bacterium GWC2_57_13]HAR44950.1 hypothetical protein [Nitrospiraceae bacterium]
MEKNDLSSKTVAELKALAKKMKITLSAGAKKADIIAALSPGVPAPAAKGASKQPAARPQRAEEKPVAKKPAAVSTPERKPVPKSVPSASEKKPARDWKMPAGAEEPLMAQERVSDAKYYTGPEERKHAPSYQELPQGYGEDKIALMARDPHWAFSYWEATPERIEREKAWFGWDSKLAVRIYDISGVQFDGRNAVGYYDQEVFDRTGEWYFDLGRPAHSFCADIGLLAPDGKFLTLARSNSIIMPRDTVSDVIDEEWMLIDEEFWKLYGFPSGSSPMEREMWRRMMMRMHGITSPGMSSPSKQKRK